MAKKHAQDIFSLYERGLLKTTPRHCIKNQADLTKLYTPGVAAIVQTIMRTPNLAYKYTGKGQTVCIASDGTSALGFGSVGPYAILPILEAKGLILNQLTGLNVKTLPIDVTDLENVSDKEERISQRIIEVLKWTCADIGAIMLEDVAAPHCVIVERALQQQLSIPVFHDDQHGTAIVVLAGLLNALKVVDKNLETVKIVINGAGSAGSAITNLLLYAGAKPENLLVLDINGILYSKCPGMNWLQEELAKKTNPKKIKGGLAEAMKGADVFIGVSIRDALSADLAATMGNQPIVFALANPDPEIGESAALQAGVSVYGCGRSDATNQINNLLAFGGIYAGLLKGQQLFEILVEKRIKVVTDDMKLNAAKALAGLVKKPTADHIIPSFFDKGVVEAVSSAITQ